MYGWELQTEAGSLIEPVPVCSIGEVFDPVAVDLRPWIDRENPSPCIFGRVHIEMLLQRERPVCCMKVGIFPGPGVR